MLVVRMLLRGSTIAVLACLAQPTLSIEPWDQGYAGIPNPGPQNQHVTVTTEVQSTTVIENENHTTYRLRAALIRPNETVYAIAGTDEFPMILPPAFQVPSLGVNIGGINPTIMDALGATQQGEHIQHDSWLTIGITDVRAPRCAAPPITYLARGC